MNHKSFGAAALCLCILSCSAGCSMISTGGNITEGSAESSTSAPVESSAKKVQENSTVSGIQTITDAVEVKEKPEIIKYSLTADCKGELVKQCSVIPYYPGHVVVSGTIGIVGSPFLVEGTDKLSDAVLTFEYNPDELRGVPEKNLRMLHFPEELDSFDLRLEDKPDIEKHSISSAVNEDGYYLLVDVYEYGSAMGLNVSEFAYEKDMTAYLSDWEREGYIGDIIRLTEKDWAKSQGSTFRVSTPEELAGVVYYSNVIARNETITIILENDIDLKGYKWAPMGWNTDAGLFFSMDGQGHSIKNMNIDIGYSQHAGFIGYALGIDMKDVTFENVEVRGGMFVGAIAGECHLQKDFENVNVSGNVSGNEKETGAYIGAGSKGNYINCKSNVFVNGQRMPFYSYDDKISNVNSDEELFTLTIDDQGRICRDQGSEKIQNDEISLRNLTWVILNENGGNVLSRLAENETSIPQDIFDAVTGGSGKYTVHLEAWKDGYIRVSNILELELPIGD